jgi:hypothetical protein
VSATADPLIPANIMLTRTVVCARPPRTRPTSSRLSVNSRSVIWPEFISAPVSRKNGIAISGALATASYIW